jgi:hypothetical protein
MSPRRKRTGRNKPRLAYRSHGQNRRPGDVHTIASFCQSNAISPSLYYKLRREGRGPVEIEIADRIVITEQAEAAWRAERQAETTARRERESAA